jgi:hypothetical protein
MILQAHLIDPMELIWGEGFKPFMKLGGGMVVYNHDALPEIVNAVGRHIEVKHHKGGKSAAEVLKDGYLPMFWVNPNGGRGRVFVSRCMWTAGSCAGRTW